MKNDILKEALHRRRGKNFNTKEFLKEPTAGLHSPDLEEKTSLVMGQGVREENLKSASNTSDDLAPSDQEFESKGIDRGKPKAEDLLGRKPFQDEESAESSGGHDDEVFDDGEYERVKRKKKPGSIYERMQMKLGKR